ncbi:bifunctional methylenetetrahydrofolate dehydrogenase/methenyltetrahydrofolate cyclohydrolase [Candidatus Legionella polyplacis]|uniref:Bifunctional protein FolD n=1 Tax=Candidatus Legionella polyplacis TaxID=2005262 RepID=A0ABZ2GW73_9GAMM|nr:tetrahydrofolate dehydrogenase/cyclohydrolase catalytic domain-containing protein [Candidatus Legionella polyplacis]ATW01919.1 bifunctional methylenetetrahydrofolate dehydrogenase/methenyltetrahydrofolate cyclohydrolase [Candidatus Legionella polyplacis]
MKTLLLDGKKILNDYISNIQWNIKKMRYGKINFPGLAVIMVGNYDSSRIYVKNKCKIFSKIGIDFYIFNNPSDITEKELIKLIRNLNNDQNFCGILVQFPLPKKININNVIESINPFKDVDGSHPYNIGKLVQSNPLFRPCVAFGIISLLDYYKISIKKRYVVVVGSSIIVGRPIVLEFLNSGATVTVCHRLTLNLKNYIKKADIVVLATGVINVISVNWLQSSQIVIDVGIHRLKNGKLRGDIDFNAVNGKVSWITPVPGGVGPMTILSLLRNILLSLKILGF